VHDNHCRLGGGNGVGHARVLLQAPDVIHHDGAKLDRACRHRLFVGVDRHWHVESAGEVCQDRIDSGASAASTAANRPNPASRWVPMTTGRVPIL
jgi:hypothetical protein